MSTDEYRRLAREFLEEVNKNSTHTDIDSVTNIEWLTRLLCSVHYKAVEMNKLDMMIQSLKDGALRDE